MAFAERFYQLTGEFTAKQKEFEQRAGELDKIQDVDSYGLPLNSAARLAFLRETCGFMRTKIDQLFGAGTSDKAFGDAMTLGMFEQFFNGVTPFIQQARDAKVTKHLNDELGGRVMK